jgi:hypothetical protein
VTYEVPPGAAALAIGEAAGGGHLPVLTYLLKKTGVCDRKIIGEALVRATRGFCDHESRVAHMSVKGYNSRRDRDIVLRFVNVMAHLFETGWVGDEHEHRALCLACEAGALKPVQLLCEGRACKRKSEALVRASANGHVSVTRYLCTAFEVDKNDALFEAATVGHADVVQCILDCDTAGAATLQPSAALPPLPPPMLLDSAMSPSESEQLLPPASPIRSRKQGPQQAAFRPTRLGLDTSRAMVAALEVRAAHSHSHLLTR